MLVKVILGTIAVLGLLLGANFAVIGWSLQEFEAELDHLEESALPSLTRWQLLVADTSALAETAPYDASVLNCAARVQLLAASRIASTPKEQIAYIRAAKKLFERELALRPQTSSSWLNLARIEFVLESSSPRWRQALLRAMTLNLRGKSMQLDLLDFRRSIESHIDPALQREFDRELVRAVRDFPAEMIIKVVRIGRADWVCGNQPDPAIAELCEIYGG